MLPWYENEKQQHRPGDWSLADCGSCLKNRSKHERQSWACAYEPPAPGFIPVQPWDHRGRKVDPGELDDRGRPTMPTCVGYVCNLPEVREAARARIHWEKSSLGHFCDGKPHERLLETLEILDASVAAFQRYELNEDKE
jgi:hypothetical protein